MDFNYLTNVITNVYTECDKGDDSMNIPIKRIGNSKGIVIPASILKMLGMDEHDEFFLSVKDDVVTLKKKPLFDPQSIEELFANYEGTLKTEIIFNDVKGREVW